MVVQIVRGGLLLRLSLLSLSLSLSLTLVAAAFLALAKLVACFSHFCLSPFQWLRQAVRNAELKRGASAQVFFNPPASLCATAHLTAALVCFPSDKRAIG